jgi:hypothetical protein
VKSLAWMYPRRVLPDRLYVPGVLELEDGRLRFTAAGQPPQGAKWDWIGERTGQHDVLERVSGGEDVPLFEVPASEVQAKLARLEAHAALVVNGHLWRVRS